MEPIQLALQKFKLSQGSRGTSASVVSTRTNPLPQPLVYRETRTVSLSPDVLVAQRLLPATQNSQFLEAFKILRTKLLHRLQEKNWNVIGVTSPGKGEGKTLISTNLAISIAMDQQHTALLIDANLRNPQVHQLFGLENKGLADFLLENIPIPELLVHPQIERLVVLPAGGPLKNSTETLNFPQMTGFIEEVKQRYPSRVVIFDLPPLLETADVIGLAPRLDALLLVVEADRTTENDLEKALLMLPGNVPLLGTVFNKEGKI